MGFLSEKHTTACCAVKVNIFPKKSLHSFHPAVLTNDHKHGDLNSHKFIFFQVWKLEFWKPLFVILGGGVGCELTSRRPQGWFPLEGFWENLLL